MATIQLGIALSEPLLHELGPAGVVTLRLLVAAAVLWPLTRPALRGRGAGGPVDGDRPRRLRRPPRRSPSSPRSTGSRSASRWRSSSSAPCPSASPGTRRRLDTLWVAAAAAGVALLTLGPGGSGLDPLGLALAGVSAVGWAGYIVLTKRVGARWSGLEGLAVALAVAAGLTLGPGVATAGTELIDPAVLAAGAGLALLAPLAPFALEMLALRRLPAAVFGVVMSLEPAIGALLGFALLGQRLGPAAIAAIGLILVASAGATLSSSRRGTSAAPANRRPRARRPRRAGAAPARA